MVYLSCTNLTQNGYKGINVNEVLERLENELLEDNRTQPAIVVWDEVDKLRELPFTHPVAVMRRPAGSPDIPGWNPLRKIGTTR